MINLRDDVELEPALLARLTTYFKALGVGPAGACAEDAVRSGVEPDHLAYRECESLHQAAGQLLHARPGRERSLLLDQIDGAARRLRLLLDSAA